MRYGSIFSGIEAATAAWHPLGWKPAFFAEFDKFPSRVLAHRYPDVPNRGDVTKFKEWPDDRLDLLVGGSPCQSFSVAGLRKGMDDPRGNLALTYCAILNRFKPRWFIFENVPGILSTDGGRAFGSILGAMAELGYGWAYRVLDAQYVRVDGFGRAVPQRRRRVFVVGHLGNWQRAAKVLFEPESLLWNSAPRRETGQRVAPTISARPTGGGGLGTDFDCDGGLIAKAFGGNNCAGPIDVAAAVNAHGGPMGRMDFESETFVAHSLRAEGFDASEDGTGRDTPLVPVGFHHNAQADQLPSQERDTSISESLTCSQGAAVAYGWAVRRLTPRECERLQGFPDDYTLIPGAADGPRYKALGNSMAVNVMRWLGYRIALVEAQSTIDVERIRTALLAEYEARKLLPLLTA
ncbi:DNA cytosine methyltransferase [Bradyrhizobium liaoningense]